MRGKATTPTPAIVVNFRCRGDTMNFMAAIGPDFKSGYSDAVPVSNADVGATAARILGLRTKPNGDLVGRVMTEAMPNGATPRVVSVVVKSEPANGLRTVLNFQRRHTALLRRRGFSGTERRSGGRSGQAKDGGEIAPAARFQAQINAMSSRVGNCCANGRAAAPTRVTTIAISLRLLRCLPRI